MRKITVYLFSIFIAACSARGCGAQERFVVLYRGSARIQPKGQVVRGGVVQGFVSEVNAAPDLQRVTVRTNSAAAFAQGDRFFASADTYGTIGFRVLPGAGAPLSNGAEIEALPSPNRPAPFARQDATPRVEMPAATAGNTPAGHPLFPANATRSADLERRRTDMFERQITRSLQLSGMEARGIPPDAAADFTRLTEKLRGKSPAEALQILNTDGASLRNTLQTRSDEAKRAGNWMGSRGIDQLLVRLERATKQTERIAGAEERRHPFDGRPPRPVPAHFR
jgi:hypothetical protein